METNVNYTLVGAFMVVLVSLIVLAVIWLSSGFASERNYTHYQVNMEESVSGLNLDAPVEYNGVKVGTVDMMTINHKKPKEVELLLKIKKDTPITQGTKAKLDSRALTGIAFILLEDKGTDLRPLTAPENQPYPIIPTTPSIFVRLNIALTELNTSFQELSKSVRSLLDEQNLNAFKKTLLSTQHSMHTLELQTIPEANKAITNFGMMSKDISKLTNDVKENPSILIRGKEKETVLGPGER